MKTLQSSVLALTIAVAAVAVPAGAPRAAAIEQVISGELVVLKGSTHQFRIVGHGGTFSAPAGTPLESLDGRPVQVEIANGRAVSITEMPVRVEPVVSGFETVRGQLQIVDPAARTFTLAGDTRVYGAPSTLDLTPYAGRWIEARLDTSGHVAELKLVPEPHAAVPPVVVSPTCSYGGQGYSDGATVCQAGTQFRCENAAWRNLGAVCGAPAPAPRTCMWGGATVANGSSICRDGTTFRCSDGTWTSTQIACR